MNRRLWAFFITLSVLGFLCGCTGNFIQGISDKSGRNPLVVEVPPRSTIKVKVADGPLTQTRVRLVSLTGGVLATGKSDANGELELSILRSAIQSLPDEDRLYLYADSDDAQARVFFNDVDSKLLRRGQARLKSFLPTASTFKSINTTELTNNPEIMQASLVSHFSNAAALMMESYLSESGVLNRPLRPDLVLAREQLNRFNSGIDETRVALNSANDLILSRFKLLSMANKAIIEEDYERSFLQSGQHFPITSSDYILSELSNNGNSDAGVLPLSSAFTNPLLFDRLTQKIETDLEKEDFQTALGASIPLSRIQTISSENLIKNATASLSDEIESLFDQAVRSSISLTQLRLSGQVGDLLVFSEFKNPLLRGATLSFAYSLDGGQNFTTSASLSAFPAEITSSQSLEFTWHSLEDTQVDTDSLWIEIRSFYKGVEAASIQTGPFQLSNLPNRSPLIANLVVDNAGAEPGVTVDLSDADGDLLDLDFQFSLDGGQNFDNSTNLSSDLRNLVPTNGFQFNWIASTDFQTNETDVIIRLVVRDPESTGNTLNSTTITLLNRPNSPPRLENLVVNGSTLDLLISVDVLDAEQDEVHLLFEYSVDSGTTFVSSLNLSRSLSSVPSGSSLTFLWNSFGDFQTDQSGVKIRLTPRDYNLSGTALISNSLVVENQPNRAPLVSDLSTNLLDEDLAIALMLQDLDGDTVDIAFTYSLDGGTTFQPTSNLEPLSLSFAPGNTQNIQWTWKSGLDFSTNEPNVFIQILPNDGSADGVALISGPLAFGNNDLPVISNLSTTGTSGLIELQFDLIDEDGDDLTLEFEYSLDGGLSWILSTNASTEGTFSSSTNLNLTWDSFKDFNSDEGSVLVRLKAFDGKESSLPETSSLFTILNNKIPASRNLLVSNTSGDIDISVEVYQEDNDPISLLFEYSLNAGSSWQASLNLTPGLDSIILPTNSSSLINEETIAFIWYSSEDFTSDETQVMVRVTPSDPQSTGQIAISTIFAVFNNHLPVASGLIVSGTSKDIDIGFDIADQDNDLVDILFEFSLDGTNWTSSENLSSSLASLQVPTAVNFVWFSASDISSDESNVLIRLTPSDGKSAGESIISSSFGLTNNDLPVVDNLLISGSSESILVSLDLSDGNDDLLSLAFEYTLDGGVSWVSSLNQDRSLTSLLPLSSTTFLWNSDLDFRTNETSVQIRLTPSDGKSDGVTGLSNILAVFNNRIPLSQNLLVSNTSADLDISVELQQADTDPISLLFEYSLDEGSSWIATLNLTPSLDAIILQTNSSSLLNAETIAFIWHSSEDFTSDETGVMVRVTPSDPQSIGETAVSTIFSVFNNHLPVASSLEVTGAPKDILISLDLNDEDNDLVELLFEFSVDGGSSWSTSANLSQSLSSIQPPTSLGFTWFSSSDFSTNETDVAIRITPSDGKSSGISLTSPIFEVFNNDPPAIENLTLSGLSGAMLVSLNLIDANNDLLSISFEFTTDAGLSWIVSQNHDRSLTSLPPLSPTTFLWNSDSDFRTNETSVQLRLIPSDGKSDGVTAISNAISIQNNHPPVASNLAISGTSQTIGISVALSDEDTDTLDLDFEYSLDDGINWSATFNVVGSLLSLSPGTTLTFDWVSSQDFMTDETAVRVRVTPNDSKDQGAILTSERFNVFNNYIPVASSLTTTGSSGEILVGVLLSDGNSDPMTFTFEFSLDSGLNFSPSTYISPILSSYPAEQTTTFLWDSSLEFSTDETEVQLRITPFDGKSTGDSALSSVFSIFNNLIPVASNLFTSQTSNDIFISVDLSDGNSDSLALTFEYTTNGFDFLTSTNTTPSLTSLIPNTSTTFLWNSYIDFTRDQATVQVRLTPSDGKSSGAPLTSTTFSVLNNHLPIASSLGLTGTSGTVIVDFDLADEDGDLLSLEFEHSLDGGLTWNPTSGVPGLENLPPFPGTNFPWQSSLDFSSDETNIRIRLRPSDSDGTGAFTTSALVYAISNGSNQPPVLTDLGINGNSGAIVIEFSLSDNESDDMNLLFEYSSDGGLSFTTSYAVSANLSAPLDDTFNKFIWRSSRDLPNNTTTAFIRLTPADSFQAGTPVTTGPLEIYNLASSPVITNIGSRLLIADSFRIDSMVPNPLDPNPDTAGQTAIISFNREIDTTSFAGIAPLTFNGSNTAAILTDLNTYTAGKFSVFKNLSFQEVRELEAIVEGYITETVPNTVVLTSGFSQFLQRMEGSGKLVYDNPSTASYSFAPSPFCAVSSTGPCTTIALGGVLFNNYNRTDHFTFFFMPSLSIARSDGLTDYTGNFLAHAVQGYGATTVPMASYFPLTQGSMRQLHAPTSTEFVFQSDGSLFIPTSAVKTDIKSIPVNPLTNLGNAIIPSTSEVFSRLATSFYTPELLAVNSADILTISQILFSDGDGVVNQALNYISAKNNGALFEHGFVKLGESQYQPPFSDLSSPTATAAHIMRPLLMSSTEILSASPFQVTSIFIGESISFSVIESFTAADLSTRYWQKDARLTYQNFYPELSISYGDSSTVFKDVLEIRRWRSVTPVDFITATSSWSLVPTTGTTTGLVEELVSWFARDAGVILVDERRYRGGVQITREDIKEVIGAIDIVDGFKWNTEILPR